MLFGFYQGGDPGSAISGMASDYLVAMLRPLAQAMPATDTKPDMLLTSMR
jgi:hypothetical protein